MNLRDFDYPIAVRLALLASITGIVVLAFADSFVTVWSLWQTNDHHHAILVLPIVAFLVWLKRAEVGRAAIRVDVLGLPVLTVLVGIWGIARLTGVQTIEHLAVLALIPAAIWTLCGRELVAVLMFPLLFVLMATPVSDALMPSLMVITADISTGLLKISGIPVLRDGQYITLPGGLFVVADVCSGVRYLITGAMLSLLFGYLTYSSYKKRALLVLIASIALILTNGVRAYIVMAVASATELEYFAGRDHIYFGWLLFGLVMISIMWIGARYADAAVPSVANAEKHSTAVIWPIILTLGLLMLVVTVKPLQSDFGDAPALLAVATALVLFMLLASGKKLARAELSDANPNRDRVGMVRQLPTLFIALLLILGAPRLVESLELAVNPSIDRSAYSPNLNCQDNGHWSRHWRPEFEYAAVEYAESFACDTGIVNVYIAAYQSMQQGSELISSANHVVPPGWDQYVTYRGEPRLSDRAPPHGIEEVVKSDSTGTNMIWYWYDIDGSRTSSPTWAKTLQVKAMLQRRPSGGSVVALETEVGADISVARDRLLRASQDLLPR